MAEWAFLVFQPAASHTPELDFIQLALRSHGQVLGSGEKALKCVKVILYPWRQDGDLSQRGLLRILLVYFFF